MVEGCDPSLLEPYMEEDQLEIEADSHYSNDCLNPNQNDRNKATTLVFSNEP